MFIFICAAVAVFFIALAIIERDASALGLGAIFTPVAAFLMFFVGVFLSAIAVAAGIPGLTYTTEKPITVEQESIEQVLFNTGDGLELVHRNNILHEEGCEGYIERTTHLTRWVWGIEIKNQMYDYIACTIEGVK